MLFGSQRPLVSLASRLSTEWRAVLLGAAIGAVLALPTPLSTGQEGVPLLVAGVAAGYLAPRDADAYAVGARAGLLLAVPLTASVLLANVDWFAAHDSVAFAVVTVAFVVLFVLAIGYLAGGIGAGIGGWLAVQFGRKEPA